ncbi:hypothetical protein OSB04_un000976 [Centaurea solstitialis]|uniref:Integrase catalytic domain-containing protein n=1 Tax=Centaurea solstitialis TaxID=347529 RepID=A0AA38VV06_9ASTR|nr:hypothetical protein OSB04_un000976 [Centaurea solstitialis]
MGISPTIIAMVSNFHIGMIQETHMAAIVTSDDWWYDSGATVHVCNNRSVFKDYVETVDGHEVLMGDHHTSKVQGTGSVELNFTSRKKIVLTKNISMFRTLGRILSLGLKVVIELDKVILSKAETFIGKGYACDGMFKLSINKISTSNYLDVSLFNTMKFMCKSGLISYNNEHKDKCEIYVQAKMKRKTFPKIERNSEILELVHSDIYELNGVITRGGCRHFITFIDDHSKFTYVYLMKTKDQAFDMFKIYKSMVETQKGKKLKILRSDRGGEYFPTNFTSFCEDHGLIHQVSAPYRPQQNGVEERKNGVLVDMVNAMLVNSSLLLDLWGEALLTACHVHNRVPSKKLKQSPYEIWKERKPNLSYLRVWGCLAYYKAPDPKKTKLGPRALKSVFLRYAENSKAYRLLDLDSNVIVESRDIDFFESKFKRDSTHLDEPISIPLRDTLVDSSISHKRDLPESSNEPRRSGRARKEKNLGPDFINSQAISFLVEGNRDTVTNKIPIYLVLKMNMIQKHILKQWLPEILLFGRNPLMMKWIPKWQIKLGFYQICLRDQRQLVVKRNTDGSIQTFKARLVAQGFSQREAVDYFDTYAPVARITSIRVLLALSSIYNLYVHQMDVKTAFMNGDLDEEVYMRQQEGFVLPGNENKVCKLTKSLYGLKQAPKQWYENFDSAILSHGFMHNSGDRCIYSKFNDDYGVIVCLYVDDMLIIGTNMKGVNETKTYLSSCFRMKDLNEVDTILGIKIQKNSGGYSISQSLC